MVMTVTIRLLSCRSVTRGIMHGMVMMELCTKGHNSDTRVVGAPDIIIFCSFEGSLKMANDWDNIYNLLQSGSLTGLSAKDTTDLFNLIKKVRETANSSTNSSNPQRRHK